MKLYTDRILKRLLQFTNYLYNANEHTYWHRLREFKHFCENTPSLAYSLAQLPKVPYDWNKQWHLVEWPLGDAAYAFRWDAIQQLASCNSRSEFNNLLWRIQSDSGAFRIFTQEFVVPLSEYLAHQLESSDTMLYILLRYKRWAQWFGAEQLRWIYSDDGEDGLDRDLRRFLFESGIDYPYSQPQSPGGRADIVAGLETDDPLVLEVKIWDSNKGYKEDRCRDGLRQVMDYADKYGKDRGYVVVFNLDPEPLEFMSPVDTGEWPPRFEHGGKTYYFIVVDIAEQTEPVSQRDKGRPVKTHTVPLAELLSP